MRDYSILTRTHRYIVVLAMMAVSFGATFPELAAGGGLSNQACCDPDGSCFDAPNTCPIAICVGTLGCDTYCGGQQACCLSTEPGVCLDADAACCEGFLFNGTALGAGSVCQLPEACCLPTVQGEEPECVMSAPGCCAGLGGISAGPGTDCADIDPPCGVQACCTPPPTGAPDFCDNCAFYDCIVNLNGTPLGSGEPSCIAQPDDDFDGVPDECDNCDPGDLTHDCDVPADCSNEDQADEDGDGVGDVCDNCTPSNPDHHCGSPGVDCVNPDQADTDGDGVGDACDNCNLFNPDQADCDNNGIGDVCEQDCDGDGTIDACDADNDIDGDGIPDDLDRCDYSPPGAPIETTAGSPFLGTMRADLDGDCDVDDDDQAIFDGFITGPATCIGTEDPLCDACPLCDPCNSCCFKSPPME